MGEDQHPSHRVRHPHAGQTATESATSQPREQGAKRPSHPEPGHKPGPHPELPSIPLPTRTPSLQSYLLLWTESLTRKPLHGRPNPSVTVFGDGVPEEELG